MMYIRGDVPIIQGKFPHAGVDPRDVPLQELSVKKDSYQCDINSCMMIMNIPPTWHKGISMQSYKATHEYPINIKTKGSKKKHDES